MARWWIVVLIVACAGLLRAAETPVEFDSVRAAALFTPLPPLYTAWLTNSSLTAHMVVDPKTGQVTNAYLVESSGNAHLNYNILNALRRWKFRPGTPRLIRISFGTVKSWHRAFPAPQRQEKRMEDVLAPFLGREHSFEANCRNIHYARRGPINAAPECLSCMSIAAEKYPR